MAGAERSDAPGAYQLGHRCALPQPRSAKFLPESRKAIYMGCTVLGPAERAPTETLSASRHTSSNGTQKRCYPIWGVSTATGAAAMVSRVTIERTV